MIEVKPILTRKQIEELIPHKSPFLFVDHVLECDDNRLIAEKTFKESEYFFEGHYPDCPVVPGVILIETLAQSAAVFNAIKGHYQGMVGFLTKVDEFVFKRQVKPNESIVMDVMLEWSNNKACYFLCKAYCDNELVTKGKIMVYFKEVEKL